jgi:ABC-type cobalt transport system, permease component CbiQ and related transporters
VALDVSVGQYFEGRSTIHKLDPRMKIIIALLYIVIIFTAKNIFSFVLLILSAILLTAVSSIPPRVFLKGLRPILLIVTLTAVLNIFWIKGETKLVDWWIFQIYLEGVVNGIMLVLRIVILLFGTSVFLTYTTTPIDLTDAIERLLSPLKKIRLPVHEFSMIMTIALRFIPTLIEETDKIMNAQKARGADFSTGKLRDRAKALIPVLIPLFVSAFRRAEELAVAMECRSYRGGDGRTKMTVLTLRKRDGVFLAAMVLLGAAVVCVNMFAPGYSLM